MNVADFSDRIARELQNIRRASTRARLAFEKCDRSNDDMFVDSAALSLLHVYGGAEKVLLVIGESIDQMIPQGVHWHRALLVQMAEPLDGVRPAVISAELMGILDEFRAFRHVARNVYAFNLHPEKVGVLVNRLSVLEALFEKDISSFLALWQ